VLGAGASDCGAGPPVGVSVGAVWVVCACAWAAAVVAMTKASTLAPDRLLIKDLDISSPDFSYPRTWQDSLDGTITGLIRL